MAIAQERKILDWQFYRNDQPLRATHQAFTWYNLGYRYKTTKITGNQIYFEFEVSLQLDTVRSFFDSNAKRNRDYELLKHEQGHADIGFLYALKLKEALAKGNFFRGNYEAAIKKIFSDVFGLMNAENLRYDQETNHGRDKMRQRNWDEYLQSEISFRSIH